MGPDIYQSQNYVTLDFETDTSHGDYGHPVHPDNQLLLACWKLGPSGGTVSHFGGEFDQDKLLKSIEAADFIVCHNAKYELGWLRRCGLGLRSVLVYDTKIGEYVLLGNLAAGCKTTGLPPRSTSLDACCRRRGWEIKDPIVEKMMQAGINPVDMPRPWLLGRCKQDVVTTERLFRHQMAELQRTDRTDVVWTRCLLTPVLADLEFEGMHLDEARVNEVYREHVARLADLEGEMGQMAHGLNWKSPMQVADFLFDAPPHGLGFVEPTGRDGRPKRTASGRRKADKHTVNSLKPTTEEQKRFLRVRSEIGAVNAALSKSLEFFRGVCSEAEAVFHAVFNQTRTATHRLSSSGHYIKFALYESAKTVQFQNMARDFKRLFSAKREGWLMMEVDGSQLEFRVAVDLGDDKQGMQDILDPEFDAHCMSGSIINNIPYEDFVREYRAGNKRYKLLRTAAKVDTFKPLYGGESGTKKQKRWYKAFKSRYSGIAETQEAWVEEVLATRRLITPWGMRYYWPRAKRGHDGYVNVKSSVYNYPVQALATAEIIPIALRRLWERLATCEGVRIVNTVHDSVILEVHPDSVDFVRSQAILAFGKDVYDYLHEVYDYDFRVPLGCGITLGTHWSEGAEESYNIWPNGKVERIT